MFHPYPLEIRFHIIAMYLEGKALTWFRLWEHQLDSWDKFREVFTFQFGNPISEHWEESSAPVLDSTTVVVSSGQSKHHFPQPSTNLTEAEFDESDDSSSHEEDNLLENAEQVQNLEDPNHLDELCFEDVSEVLSDGLSIQISTQECPLSDKINNGIINDLHCESIFYKTVLDLKTTQYMFDKMHAKQNFEHNAHNFDNVFLTLAIASSHFVHSL